MILTDEDMKLIDEHMKLFNYPDGFGYRIFLMKFLVHYKKKFEIKTPSVK